MIQITTEVQSRELMSALDRLRRKTGNLRPVMSEIAETMRSSVEENFKQESARKPIGGAKGGAWQALAASTEKARARIGKTGRKLQVTGQLLASIQTKTSDGEAIIGTNKKYARFLNDGTKRMPARPFLVLQQADVDEMKQIVQEHFRGL
jgi:phage virion morphogenesis protein